MLIKDEAMNVLANHHLIAQRLEIRAAIYQSYFKVMFINHLIQNEIIEKSC